MGSDDFANNRADKKSSQDWNFTDIGTYVQFSKGVGVSAGLNVDNGVTLGGFKQTTSWFGLAKSHGWTASMYGPATYSSGVGIGVPSGVASPVTGAWLQNTDGSWTLQVGIGITDTKEFGGCITYGCGSPP